MPPRVCSAARACRFACSRSRRAFWPSSWLTRTRSSPATICGSRSGTTAPSSTSSAASTFASRRSDRRWAMLPIRRVSSRPCPGVATDSSRPSTACLVQSRHCRRARVAAKLALSCPLDRPTADDSPSPRSSDSRSSPARWLAAPGGQPPVIVRLRVAVVPFDNETGMEDFDRIAQGVADATVRLSCSRRPPSASRPSA